LVLIGILPLPLLVLGAILGVVSSATTSETPVVVGLTVLPPSKLISKTLLNTKRRISLRGSFV
jgi:hypothetical protein